MSFSERIDTPILAMDLAGLNRKIIEFMGVNPELAPQIKEVKETAEKAARDRGMGALDAMAEGHKVVMDRFPQLQEALGKQS